MASVLKYFGVLINYTPSIKRGIYIKEQGEIRRGDIVAVCLKKNRDDSKSALFFIPCAHPHPLIKKVIAVPGDTVILRKTFIAVNGQYFLFNTLYFDSEGNPISHYPFGKYEKTIGYWLIGSDAPNSWDSRYFGPIDIENVLNKIRPIFIIGESERKYG
jgi:conjugative transfer signal peptidase TraF